MSNNIAILISGRGSNMMAIVKAIQTGQCNANLKLIFSNNPEAAGLNFAQDKNIPYKSFKISDFKSKEAYEKQLCKDLKSVGVDYVILAGYMRLIGPDLLHEYKGKILNIHPSLLPKFKGLHAQKQALEAGETEAGCTVHFVDESLDGGPIISQSRVPVLKHDTEESLSNRILEKEHLLYPKIIHNIVNNIAEEI